MNNTDLPTGKLRDLSLLLWLGLPAASLAVVLLAPLLGPEACHALLSREFGFLELGTAVFLLPTVVLSVLLLRHRRRLPRPALVVLLLGGLAALYFLGEETSWGQQLLGLTGALDVERLERHEQFALHTHEELSDLFNNLPRQMMLAACIVGGIILPLVLRLKLSRPETRRSPWYWIIPTWRLVPASLLAVFSTVPEKIFAAWWPQTRGTYLHLALVDAAGEFKEYCYALVMFLYFLSVHARLRRAEAPQADPSAVTAAEESP